MYCLPSLFCRVSHSAKPLPSVFKPLPSVFKAFPVVIELSLRTISYFCSSKLARWCVCFSNFGERSVRSLLGARIITGDVPAVISVSKCGHLTRSSRLPQADNATQPQRVGKPLMEAGASARVREPCTSILATSHKTCMPNYTFLPPPPPLERMCLLPTAPGFPVERGSHILASIVRSNAW
jgi:hypothetical protein